MSRRHIATHAYDFHTGWVRITPTALTHEQAVKLHEQGFTIVRSRRGWFGTRELPLSWYLRRAGSDTSEASRLAVSPAAVSPNAPHERPEDPPDTVDLVDAPDPRRPSPRRARQRSTEDGG